MGPTLFSHRIVIRNDMIIPSSASRRYIPEFIFLYFKAGVNIDRWCTYFQVASGPLPCYLIQPDVPIQGAASP